MTVIDAWYAAPAVNKTLVNVRLKGPVPNDMGRIEFTVAGETFHYGVVRYSRRVATEADIDKKQHEIDEQQDSLPRRRRERRPGWRR